MENEQQIIYSEEDYLRDNPSIPQTQQDEGIPINLYSETLDIKSIVYMQGDSKTTAQIFKVELQNGMILYVSNKVGAKYLEDVLKWSGEFKSEFTDTEILENLKKEKMEIMKNQYEKAKSNVFLKLGNIELETKYSIKDIKEILQNKIDCNRFPDYYTLDNGTQLPIQTLEAALNIKEKLSIGLDNYWKNNFKPHQETITNTNNLETLKGMEDFWMARFVVEL